MSPFGLPPTNRDHAPEFSTAAECKAWLDAAPLTQPAAAQARLLKALHLLDAYTLPLAERLAILELLRGPVSEVQEAGLKRFAGKPLPLLPAEEDAYLANCNLWKALRSGYLRCADECLGAGAKGKPEAALATQRTLTLMTALQMDIYRAGQQPDGDHWRLLHGLLLAAEQLQVVTTAVADALRNGSTPTTPSAAYVEALLVHAASPHELSPRRLSWVTRWARRWSAKVQVLADPPTLSTRAIPLCVYVTSDRPAGYLPLGNGEARWLETADLRRSLKQRLVLLAEGRAPADLQLGSDCTQPACGELLKTVYQHWCKGGAARHSERHASTEACAFVTGIDGIHYYIAGRKPFRQPGNASDDTLRRQRDEIATFGRISNRDEEDYSRQHELQVEQWQVEEDWRVKDESVDGLRISRPLRQEGHRLGQGQLVAVRPAHAKHYLIGQARWVMLEGAERLTAGIAIIPGQPEPVALRGTGVAAIREPYRQGLLLPALAALNSPASVILPAGWFRREGILEVFTDRARQIRLTQLLDRGSDYERAAYVYV